MRRRFVACEADFAEATHILDLIDEMFRHEREIRDVLEAEGVEDAELRRNVRKRLRGEWVRPVFEELFAYATKIPVLTSTALGKAIRYMVNRRDRLRVFLDHPDVPLTNSDAERALRAGVIGRKNFNGPRSRRGEVLAGIFHTLCGTAKMCNIPPPAYIEAVVRHARAHAGTPLLPEDYLRLYGT